MNWPLPLLLISFFSMPFPTTPPPLSLLSISQFLLIFQNLAQSLILPESLPYPPLPKLVTDSSPLSLYIAWASLDLRISQIEISKFVYVVVLPTRQGALCKEHDCLIYLHILPFLVHSTHSTSVLCFYNNCCQLKNAFTSPDPKICLSQCWSDNIKPRSEGVAEDKRQ